MKLTQRQKDHFSYLELELLQLVGKDKLNLDSIVKELFPIAHLGRSRHQVRAMIKRINVKLLEVGLDLKITVV